MPTSSIYRTPEGEAELNRLYDLSLAQIGMPYECRTAATRFGPTNVVVTGPKNGRPLVVVHGAYHDAPSNLKLFRCAAEHFRTYALDTVGQSVRSAQTLLSVKDNSYGIWIEDVLNALGLEQTAITGASFGAGIALRAMVHAPGRFTKAALVVPAGIANGSILKMAQQLFLPWLMYFRSPSPARLLAAASPMMTEPDPEFLTFIDAFLRNVHWKPEGPKLTRPGEMKGFTAPVLLFVTDDDCFFPGNKVEERAREIIPNLAGVEHLHGKHMPSAKSMEWVNQRIVEFLSQ